MPIGRPRRWIGGLALLIGVVAGSAVVAACSSADNEFAKEITSASTVVTATVRATAEGFDVATVTVKAGDGIEFVNADSIDRSFQAGPDDTFDSGVQNPGDTFLWRTSTPGTYTVSDRLMPSALLTITVT